MLAVDTLASIAVPKQATVAEQTVKGSKFIGSVARATSVDDADAFITAVRKAHFTANHNVYAYRIDTSDQAARSSDDGEPSGTAGQPVLRQIDRLGIAQIVLVVTRYFGGTKLGTGGLIRAYGDCAAEVLSQTPLETFVHVQEWIWQHTYEQTPEVTAMLHHQPVFVAHRSYDATVSLTLWTATVDTDRIAGAAHDAVRGSSKLEPLRYRWVPASKIQD